MDELLGFVFDSAIEGMLFLDSGFRVLEANAAAASMFGLSPAGMKGQGVFDPRWRLYRQDGRPMGQEDYLGLKALLRGEAPGPGLVGVGQAERPEPMWLQVRARPRPLRVGREGLGGAEFLLITLENVTEARLAQERLSRRMASLNAINDYALELDSTSMEGLYDLIAESARIIFDARAGAVASYRPETRELVVEAISLAESLESGVTRLIGRGLKKLAAPVSEAEYRTMMELKVGLASTLREFSFGRVPAKISEAIETSLGIGWFRGIVLVSEGRLFGGLGLAGGRGEEAPPSEELRIFGEITANGLRRKLAEARIEGLLEEKETLLKEVHHRIKNNMNTMISLLSLQSRACKDGDDAVQALQDAMGRLQSMSTLYDKLYRGEDLQSLSLADYLPTLVREIVATFPGGEAVELAFKVEDIRLGTRQLPLVGIIVNELVTNAMKYAFPGGKGGTLTVSAYGRKSRLVLMVEDDGVGLPAGFDAGNSGGFGLGLIQILAKQLDASLSIESRRGARFTLDIPVL